MNRKQYCIANWKMNITPTQGVDFITKLKTNNLNRNASLVICPSFTGLYPASEAMVDTPLVLGSQNLFYEEKGAFTGEVSTDMLIDSGCKMTILGHSERRHVFGEDNTLIERKLLRALSQGLTPILCIGEKLSERESGNTKSVLAKQLESALANVEIVDQSKIIIAYEPVWAIGTGVTATLDQVEDTHKEVRDILNELSWKADTVSILYGGSVSQKNSRELINVDGVDGFLIGGASLKVETFYDIYRVFN
jgi:triosephosphate isomerase (TIM)